MSSASDIPTRVAAARSKAPVWQFHHGHRQDDSATTGAGGVLVVELRLSGDLISF